MTNKLLVEYLSLYRRNQQADLPPHIKQESAKHFAALQNKWEGKLCH